MRTIAAGVFKARCLAIIEEVRARREPVVITKRGQPLAKLVPMPRGEDEIFGFYRGRLKITGDVVSPLPTEESRRIGRSRQT
jgi:prevent-host-death family protein